MRKVSYFPIYGCDYSLYLLDRGLKLGSRLVSCHHWTELTCVTKAPETVGQADDDRAHPRISTDTSLIARATTMDHDEMATDDALHLHLYKRASIDTYLARTTLRRPSPPTLFQTPCTSNIRSDSTTLQNGGVSSSS